MKVPFVDILCEKLEDKLDGFTVSKKENLIYKVIVNEDLKFEPNPQKSKRGMLAFQTDILIKKGDLPLVVIEAKYNSLTTHDILVYSTKALKHKDVYPHLRYGLVVGGFSFIPVRFFTHNYGFDFASVIKDPDSQEIEEFPRIVYGQAKVSERLLEILKNKRKTKVYDTMMVLEDGVG